MGPAATASGRREAGWAVDPGFGWDLRRPGPGGEPFGVCGVRGVEGGLAVGDDDGVVAGMQVGGAQVADAGVVVDLVVPTEEPAAPRPGVADGGEPVGVVGPVLERLDMRFDELVDMRPPRPGVRLGDAQVVEELGDGAGDHRAATVGVDRQLVTVDTFFTARLVDQPAGDLLRFALGDRPTT